jgi:hypothetical protein
MRRAQLRLRHVITMAAVGLLVALATVSSQGQHHALNGVAERVPPAPGLAQRLPNGRRWY